MRLVNSIINFMNHFRNLPLPIDYEFICSDTHGYFANHLHLNISCNCIGV